MILVKNTNGYAVLHCPCLPHDALQHVSNFLSVSFNKLRLRGSIPHSPVPGVANLVAVILLALTGQGRTRTPRGLLPNSIRSCSALISLSPFTHWHMLTECGITSPPPCTSTTPGLPYDGPRMMTVLYAHSCITFPGADLRLHKHTHQNTESNLGCRGSPASYELIPSRTRTLIPGVSPPRYYL